MPSPLYEDTPLLGVMNPAYPGGMAMDIPVGMIYLLPGYRRLASSAACRSTAPSPG